MTYHIIALLDPPSGVRFRALPYLLDKGDPWHYVVGYDRMLQTRKPRDHLAELVEAGYARELKEPVEVPAAFGDRVGWTSWAFKYAAQAAEAPALHPKALRVVELADGYLWFPPEGQATRQVIAAWLLAAATEVVRRGKCGGARELAHLMARCAPDSELTRAACHSAEGGTAEHDRMLDWHARLGRDRGQGAAYTVEAQTRRYTAIITALQQGEGLDEAVCLLHAEARGDQEPRRRE